MLNADSGFQNRCGPAAPASKDLISLPRTKCRKSRAKLFFCEPLQKFSVNATETAVAENADHIAALNAF